MATLDGHGRSVLFRSVGGVWPCPVARRVHSRPHPDRELVADTAGPDLSTLGRHGGVVWQRDDRLGRSDGPHGDCR